MKKFKTESQRVLDIMINSIYTHKEIFLRELISNASDAIDKLYYKSLNENLGLSKEDFSIMISTNSQDRSLTISDNGIGMTSNELEDNLGVIAKSGSAEFKNAIEKSNDVNIIGQFGVGFYSAFMVSDRVEVLSRPYGSDEATLWSSNGAEGYNIAKSTKEEYGTKITMYLKADTEEEKFSDFIAEYKIRDLIKKYSNYIRYPIKMDVEQERTVEGKEDEFETYTETETLNSMVPIWKKRKVDITESEYNDFYKSAFYDYTDAARVIHSVVEGNINYTALLFIPAKAPYNYYSKGYEKGIKLYTNDVMIMEKSKDLLPDYFGFVKGLVDSDVTLNISRETVQHNAQLKKIASTLEKKVKSELLDMLENDREKYEKFYKEFGLQLKYGIYEGWGINKDALMDLVMFMSVNKDKMITFKEYVADMKTDQKFIFYSTAKSVSSVKSLPQSEKVLDAGYDILVFSDDVDEFAIKMLLKYDEKEFKSISAGDLGIDNSTPVIEKDDDKSLTDFMKETLGDRIVKVRISDRLKKFPVCLTTEGEVSIEMEKLLNAMPNNDKVKADKILEINAEHPIYAKLKSLLESNKDSLKVYTTVLYNQARLIEGLNVESPAEFTADVISLIS